MELLGGAMEVAGLGKHDELVKLAQVHGDIQPISVSKKLILDGIGSLDYAWGASEL